MTLPWFRFDTSFPSHDKVIDLVETGDRGRAAGFVYVCGLAYCQANETDGLIPFGALPFMHAKRSHASLLVAVGMWKPHPRGWEVVNYLERQPSTQAIQQQRADRSRAGRKGNCSRWHQQPCGCWASEDESATVVLRSQPDRARTRSRIAGAIATGSQSDRTDGRTD